MNIYTSETFDDRYQVRWIEGKLGKPFVKQYHYSKGISIGARCYGLFFNGELVGVCAFNTPCSENVRASVLGKEYKSHITELHRLVLLDEVPKNAESFFISRALKLLKKDKPYYWAVLSFADGSCGHLGIIYQATNAIYSGMTKGRATFYLDQDGRLRHPRQNGVNILLSMAKERGWVPVKREGKHRYLFLLPDDKRHRRFLETNLKLKRLNYPKSCCSS